MFSFRSTGSDGPIRSGPVLLERERPVFSFFSIYGERNASPTTSSPSSAASQTSAPPSPASPEQADDRMEEEPGEWVYAEEAAPAGALAGAPGPGSPSGKYGSLRDAVLADDPLAVGSFLADGADPRVWDPAGDTLLHVASGPETARLLMAAGLSPFNLSLIGVPAVCTVKGLPALVALLDAAGPGSIESGRLADYRGRTPAHHHAFRAGTPGYDDAETAEKMIELFARGFSPNDADDDGRTPLMFAAAAQRAPETAMAILEAGGDPFAADLNGGVTALHRCCLPRVAAELVGRGVSPSVPTEDGRTPLHTNRLPEVVRALLALGADVAARTTVSRDTPLHSARCKLHALALIEGGADLEACNVLGETPLISRSDSAEASAETIEALLDAGADASVVSFDGFSLLSCLPALSPSGRSRVAGALARSVTRRRIEVDSRSRGPRRRSAGKPTPASERERSFRSADIASASAAVGFPPLDAFASYDVDADDPERMIDDPVAVDGALVSAFYREVASACCRLAADSDRAARKAEKDAHDAVASLGHWAECAAHAARFGG